MYGSVWSHDRSSGDKNHFHMLCCEVKIMHKQQNALCNKIQQIVVRRNYKPQAKSPTSFNVFLWSKLVMAWAVTCMKCTTRKYSIAWTSCWPSLIPREMLAFEMLAGWTGTWMGAGRGAGIWGGHIGLTCRRHRNSCGSCRSWPVGLIHEIAVHVGHATKLVEGWPVTVIPDAFHSLVVCNCGYIMWQPSTSREFRTVIVVARMQLLIKYSSIPAHVVTTHIMFSKELWLKGTSQQQQDWISCWQSVVSGTGYCILV